MIDKAKSHQNSNSTDINYENWSDEELMRESIKLQYEIIELNDLKSDIKQLFS